MVNKDCKITLIKETALGPPQITAGAEPVAQEKKRTVFALKRSVNREIFTQAAAQGFKVVAAVSVLDFEYDNEQIAELENERFRIFKTTPIKNTERIELLLRQMAGDSDVATK